MKTYEKNILDRKVLVKRLEELTGKKGKYTFVPRCAYLFDGCAVEKDGTLTAEDGMDQSVIDTLIAEGLIKGGMSEAEAESDVVEETPEATEGTEGEEPAGNMETADESENTEAADEPETADDGADSLTISLPMDRHTPESLRRLLNMVYSRGKLLSKATGGTFSVDKELLDALDEAGTVTNREDFISMVQEHGGLIGITFDDGKINFTGFSFSFDAEKIKALQQLTCMMNKHALEQKRIQAKVVNDANEKYIFRIWLVRLGMDGSEYKETRRILMENLSGHTAFRTKADEEKWKARQQEKRDALKAAKAEEEAVAETV